jgi:uncharacterized protein
MIFKNAISWFEIPTNDISRAQKFYETIFDISMTVLDMAQLQMRLFPTESAMSVGGALTYNKDFYKPSASDGPLIYLNGNPDVQIILDKLKTQEGK